MVLEKALILLDNRTYKNNFLRNKKKTKFSLMFYHKKKKTVDGLEFADKTSANIYVTSFNIIKKKSSIHIGVTDICKLFTPILRSYYFLIFSTNIYRIKFSSNTSFNIKLNENIQEKR